MGGGQRSGQAAAHGGRGRDGGGQGAVGHPRERAAGDHPSQGGADGADRGVGVPHGERRREGGRGVQGEHRRAVDDRACRRRVHRVQQGQQVVQGELPGREGADHARDARGPIGQRDGHGAQQRQQHRQQRQVGQGAAARDVAGGRQQGAEHGQRGAPHARSDAAGHGIRR